MGVSGNAIRGPNSARAGEAEPSSGCRVRPSTVNPESVAYTANVAAETAGEVAVPLELVPELAAEIVKLPVLLWTLLVALDVPVAEGCELCEAEDVAPVATEADTVEDPDRVLPAVPLVELEPD